jgi:hypothetical protein
MEHDDNPEGTARSPKPERTTPTDADMSRFAREAVRQPPDPRLDKELARMGLTDAPEASGAVPDQPRGRPAVVNTEIDGLRADLRRLEMILWVLVAVTAILALSVVYLLIR